MSTHMSDPSVPRAAARVAALTAMLLLVPLVAMQFTAEVIWAPGDFVAAGLLLFGAGMAYMLAARRSRTTRQKVVVGALVFAVLAVVWAELAVGLFH
jgi:hypothetical protein